MVQAGATCPYLLTPPFFCPCGPSFPHARAWTLCHCPLFPPPAPPPPCWDLPGPCSLFATLAACPSYSAPLPVTLQITCLQPSDTRLRAHVAYHWDGSPLISYTTPHWIAKVCARRAHNYHTTPPHYRLPIATVAPGVDLFCLCPTTCATDMLTIRSTWDRPHYTPHAVHCQYTTGFYPYQPAPHTRTWRAPQALSPPLPTYTPYAPSQPLLPRTT